MHVFNANFTAIGVLKCIDKFTKFPVLLSSEEASHFWDINVELSVKICIGEAISLIVEKVLNTSLWQLEFGSKVRELLIVSLIELEGVYVSLHVAMGHVCSNQHHQFLRLLHFAGDIFCCSRSSRAC